MNWIYQLPQLLLQVFFYERSPVRFSDTIFSNFHHNFKLVVSIGDEKVLSHIFGSETNFISSLKKPRYETRQLKHIFFFFWQRAHLVTSWEFSYCTKYICILYIQWHKKILETWPDNSEMGSFVTWSCLLLKKKKKTHRPSSFSYLLLAEYLEEPIGGAPDLEVEDSGVPHSTVEKI